MAKYGQQVDKPKPHNDVYTGLLAVSLVGMLIGCGLLYLDYRQYEGSQPPKAADLPNLTKLPPGPAKGVEPPPVKREDAGKKEELPKKDDKEMKKDDKEMKKDDAKKDDAKKDDAKKDAKKDDAKKE